MSEFKNKSINYRLLEAFPGSDLAAALSKKLGRKVLAKLGRRDRGYERAVSYNGVIVFDRPELHG
jgi:hypothetical protein